MRFIKLVWIPLLLVLVIPFAMAQPALGGIAAEGECE